MPNNALINYVKNTLTKESADKSEYSKKSKIKQQNYIPEEVQDIAKRIVSTPAAIKPLLATLPEVNAAALLNTAVVDPVKEDFKTAKHVVDYMSSPASFATVLGFEEDGTPILNDPSKPMPPTSQDVANFAISLGTAGLGTSFATGGIPKGALGMFAGPKARNWQSRGLDDFYDLAMKDGSREKGVAFSPALFYKKTGYYPDLTTGEAVKIIRPETLPTLNLKPLENTNNSVSLASIYDNPAIYAEYPELKDIAVQPYSLPKSAVAGYYSPYNSTIYINRGLKQFRDPAQASDILAHEAQHAIQEIEKSAYRGSSINAETDALSQHFAQELFKSGDIDRGLIESVTNTMREDPKVRGMSEYLYTYNPGEVQSRYAELIQRFPHTDPTKLLTGMQKRYNNFHVLLDHYKLPSTWAKYPLELK